MASKQVIRKRVRDIVLKMSPEERRRQSQEVFNKLVREKWFLDSKNVGLYVSLEREVDTRPIFKFCFDSGKRVFIPRYSLTSRQMDMLSVESLADLDALPETKWKIKQPPMDDLSHENALDVGLDLVLVPGVAFTVTGVRLGNGFGFYDRFLYKIKTKERVRPLLVGLAFTQQILDHLPNESHDFTLDRVLWP